MTLGFSTELRNARADAITATAGNGAKLRLYDGTRPATGGAATNLLAELTCGTPFAAAADAGVLTLSAITQDNAADATANAAWFRIVKSDNTFVMDGSAGTADSDWNLNTVSIVQNGPVACTTFTITEGNA